MVGKLRGVYENKPGSGVWYIRYSDGSGKIQRESIGPKSLAMKVLHLRQAAAAERRHFGRHNKRSQEIADLQQQALTDAVVAIRSEGRAGVRRPTMVYFVRAANGGPIKIGAASNIQKRVTQLQTSSPFPLIVLATIPGGRRVERELHERFARLHVHGEWFRPRKPLLDFIKSLALQQASGGAC